MEDILSYDAQDLAKAEFLPQFDGVNDNSDRMDTSHDVTLTTEG